jgi:hypothetical protein
MDPVPAWCAQFAGRRDLLAKPFVYLAIVRYMMEAICPRSRWRHRVAEHLSGFPEQMSQRKLSIGAMGAPEDWEPLWRAERGQ